MDFIGEPGNQLPFFILGDDSTDFQNFALAPGNKSPQPFVNNFVI